MEGFTVAVKEGGSIIGFLKEQGITSLVTYPSYEAIIRAARDNKVSVFSVDQPAATYFLHKYGLVDHFKRTAPVNSGEFHRAVRKGDSALLGLVNEGFAKIPAEELQRIEQHWYGSTVGHRVHWNYLLVGIGTGFLLVALLLLSNLGLRRLVARRTKELQSSEELYRELVQQSDSIILRWNRDGVITFFNDYGLRFFGFEAEELVGKRVWDTIVPARQDDGRDLQLMMHEIFSNVEQYRTDRKSVV